ncbi:MAG: hypothetical protein ACRDKE_08105, partial [Solirubrobacterales bacterium]
MSFVVARSSHAVLNFILATFALIALTLVLASSASAQQDNFANGDGHDGNVTFNAAGTFSPNAVAPIPGALTAGATSVTIGTVRAGAGANAVGFANNRLVMIYQSNGTSATPTSADQTAYPLSTSTAGHWEFARASTVAGSVLTLSAPLIYNYPAGTAQAIAVPEWANLTVSNAGVNITAQNWNGSSGGVVSVLVQTLASFTAAGTVSANSAGFRGGIAYNENAGATTDCPTTQYNAPSVAAPYANKGEGFYTAGYTASTPATTTTQAGRGNYIHAGGGGNCFNAGGGGGGNGGQGGLGG